MELPDFTPRPQSWAEAGAEVRASWEGVVSSLKTATLELIPDLSAEELQGLEDSFWKTHVALLEKAEQTIPGISAQIFDRAEEITAARRRAEQQFFEATTLPNTKRRAFIDGLMGRPFRPDDV
jgi:hypothetical protein